MTGNDTTLDSLATQVFMARRGLVELGWSVTVEDHVFTFSRAGVVSFTDRQLRGTTLPKDLGITRKDKRALCLYLAAWWRYKERVSRIHAEYWESAGG